MLKLSVKFIIIIILIVTVYLYIVYNDICNSGTINNYDSYTAAVIDKVKMLKNSKPGKILLVGGSNIAFGVNSEKIHLSTNKPVINLGLQIGTGLNFMFKLCNNYICKGDIVICSPEYEYFVGNRFYGQAVLIDTLYFIPEYYKLMLDIPQLNSIIEKNIIRNNNIRNRGLKSIFTLNTTIPPADDVNFRKAFNKYGDLTSYINKPNKEFKVSYKLAEPENFLIIKLAEVKRSVENKGAVFILAYPSITKSQYKRNKSKIDSLHKSLVSAGLIRFTSPEDFVFDDECFFDSSYHLNSICRDKRTQRLIDLINNNLSVQK